MVRILIKYLFAIGVVFFGFQINAFADEEKDKKDEKTASSTAKRDTIVIKSIGDITVGDTLVFDDFDEDEEDHGENGSIAMLVPRSNNGHTNSQQIASIVYQIDGYPISESNNLQVNTEANTIVEPENLLVEMSTSLEVNVYPNPTAQAFQPINISHNLMSEVQIAIFSTNGQLAKSISTTDKLTTISDLNSGIYIVTITGENQMESRKLIVH